MLLVLQESKFCLTWGTDSAVLYAIYITDMHLLYRLSSFHSSRRIHSKIILPELLVLRCLKFPLLWVCRCYGHKLWRRAELSARKVLKWELTVNCDITSLSKTKCPVYSSLLFMLLIYRNVHTIIGPPLWSSRQSSWLQIQRPRFDSKRYQIFWKVAGLVSTIGGTTWKKSSDCGLEIREYGRRDPSRWSRGTLYSQKLALINLPTSGGCSVVIVRSRTQTTEYLFFCPSM
jgi:hypothetical protein